MAAHAPGMMSASRADPVTPGLISLHTGCFLLYTPPSSRPHNHLIFTFSSGTCSRARANRFYFLLLGTSSPLLDSPSLCALKNCSFTGSVVFEGFPE